MFKNLALIVAQSLDLKITPSAAETLSNFAELELRKIIDDAGSFMRLSKRTTLLPQDINAALQLHNQQVHLPFLYLILFPFTLACFRVRSVKSTTLSSSARCSRTFSSRK